MGLRGRGVVGLGGEVGVRVAVVRALVGVLEVTFARLEFGQVAGVEPPTVPVHEVVQVPLQCGQVVLPVGDVGGVSDVGGRRGEGGREGGRGV